MSLILPPSLTEDNKNYNILFSNLQPKIMKEIKQIINDENVGNKTNATKLEQYYAAINYVFTLYTIAQYSQDIDFWKEKMEYETIKNCYMLKGINLDNLLTLIT
jgi:hypothetical protein